MKFIHWWLLVVLTALVGYPRYSFAQDLGIDLKRTLANTQIESDERVEQFRSRTASVTKLLSDTLDRCSDDKQSVQPPVMKTALQPLLKDALDVHSEFVETFVGVVRRFTSATDIYNESDCSRTSGDPAKYFSCLRLYGDMNHLKIYSGEGKVIVREGETVVEGFARWASNCGAKGRPEGDVRDVIQAVANELNAWKAERVFLDTVQRLSMQEK